MSAPICSICNNQRLGLLDEQVARCGPEGFMREFYGVKGRAHHAAVNPFARGFARSARFALLISFGNPDLLPLLIPTEAFDKYGTGADANGDIVRRP